LSGKTDTIAGQTNIAWIEAGKPGVYRGQCTEYCGLQHAHMGLMAVAEPPDRFDAWWNQQLDGPALPVSDPSRAAALQGQQTFMRRCAVCHAVRGTSAAGRVGPDLSHLMQRRTIAAGTVPNTAGYLAGWISSPQHIKPGNFMPTLDLSGRELNEVETFLAALK
jgi:cytochrome c oxidase subunit 2